MGHRHRPLLRTEVGDRVILHEFTFDDAGTYWYHPHINSSARVGWGLYDAIVVGDPPRRG